jgi:hypothetical protein
VAPVEILDGQAFRVGEVRFLGLPGQPPPAKPFVVIPGQTRRDLRERLIFIVRFERRLHRRVGIVLTVGNADVQFIHARHQQVGVDPG